MEVPDDLDLSDLRGTGLQPGEEQLPEQEADKPKEPGTKLFINDMQH